MYLHVNWDSLHGYTNCHIYHIEEQLSSAQICRLPLSPDPYCESQAESQVRTIQSTSCIWRTEYK